MGGRVKRKLENFAFFPEPTLAPQARTEAPLRPRTEAQRRYIAAIQHAVLTFGIGPAGTGKTYIAARLAADAIAMRRIERVIVTRPVVEAGESLGFLPGELDEKFEPFFAPVREVFESRLGRGHVDALVNSGRIMACPLAYMRGRTFRDAFVLLDEAQNVSPVQMKLFLTRIGENATVVVDGDPEQCDIGAPHGLLEALARLQGLPGVAVVGFERRDIVRSDLAQQIVEAYAQPLALKAAAAAGHLH